MNHLPQRAVDGPPVGHARPPLHLHIPPAAYLRQDTGYGSAGTNSAALVDENPFFEPIPFEEHLWANGLRQLGDGVDRAQNNHHVSSKSPWTRQGVAFGLGFGIIFGLLMLRRSLFR